jgi:hypothetical protein
MLDRGTRHQLGALASLTNPTIGPFEITQSPHLQAS